MADVRNHFLFKFKFSLLLMQKMYIALITLHLIKVKLDQTEILIFQVLVSIFRPVLCLFLQQQQKKRGGGMILNVMNQVYNACVIQCTIQNFHHYY